MIKVIIAKYHELADFVGDDFHLPGHSYNQHSASATVQKDIYRDSERFENQFFAIKAPSHFISSLSKRKSNEYDGIVAECHIKSVIRQDGLKNDKDKDLIRPSEHATHFAFSHLRLLFLFVISVFLVIFQQYE